MKYFFAFILILALFLESSIVTYPLVLGVLLMMVALYRSTVVLWIAFFSGIVLDILTFHVVGGSSLFFLGTLLLIFLYQRKFEIQSPVFVGVSVFVFSLLYGGIFIHKYAFFSALFTVVIISVVYVGLLLLERKRE